MSNEDRFKQAPFDDYKGFGVYLAQEDLDYLSNTPPEKVDPKRLAGLVMNSRSFDSEFLHHLVDIYEDELKMRGYVNAMYRLHITINETKITHPAIHDCLIHATRGDLAAIHILVRACPETIVFPFVQDAMIDVLQKHKYDEPGETKRHKEEWNQFLVPQTVGSFAFNQNDITMLMRGHKMQHRRIVRQRSSGSIEREGVTKSIGVSEKRTTKVTCNTARKERRKK